MCRRISQRVLRWSTEGLRWKLCRESQRCCLFTGNWWQPVTHRLTGDASRNTQKALAPRQSYREGQPLNILQVWNSNFWNVVMNNADVWKGCDHRSCEHFHRQLWLELGEGFADKTSQGCVQVWLHHCIHQRGTGAHSYALLSHRPQGISMFLVNFRIHMCTIEACLCIPLLAIKKNCHWQVGYPYCGFMLCIKVTPTSFLIEKQGGGFLSKKKSPKADVCNYVPLP